MGEETTDQAAVSQKRGYFLLPIWREYLRFWTHHGPCDLSYREDYLKKEELYLKQLEVLEREKDEGVTSCVFEIPWVKRLLDLKDIEVLDRDIVVEMIHRITIYEDKKIKISYNFSNELEYLFSSVYNDI